MLLLKFNTLLTVKEIKYSDTVIMPVLLNQEELRLNGTPAPRFLLPLAQLAMESGGVDSSLTKTKRSLESNF